VAFFHEIDDLLSSAERVEYFQNLLVDRATGGSPENGHYFVLREEILGIESIADLIPTWLKTNRTLEQFWQFIKYEYDNYADRRRFIWDVFNPIISRLEKEDSTPSDKNVGDILERVSPGGIQKIWEKALDRRNDDPEGAITISRTMLESVCKTILDLLGVDYDKTRIELSDLYKKTANELNLAPEQHMEPIFKQILGGCSGVVNGLGSLRNKLGDAHGQGETQIRPKPRHAELAVNLAGAMSLYLLSTFEETHE
jgi:hypothetical protein